MVGSSDEIVDAAVQFTPNGLKEAMRVAVRFLLWSQFIQNQSDSNIAWRVKAGSGVSLPHSGEVSDALMLAKVGWHSSSRQSRDLFHQRLRAIQI